MKGRIKTYKLGILRIRMGAIIIITTPIITTIVHALKTTSIIQAIIQPIPEVIAAITWTIAAAKLAKYNEKLKIGLVGTAILTVALITQTIATPLLIQQEQTQIAKIASIILLATAPLLFIAPILAAIALLRLEELGANKIFKMVGTIIIASTLMVATLTPLAFAGPQGQTILATIVMIVEVIVGSLLIKASNQELRILEKETRTNIGSN